LSPQTLIIIHESAKPVQSASPASIFRHSSSEPYLRTHLNRKMHAFKVRHSRLDFHRAIPSNAEKRALLFALFGIDADSNAGFNLRRLASNLHAFPYQRI